MAAFKMYCVILDLGYPMDQQTLESILTALENVLTLTWCSRTQNKSHSIFVCSINHDAENLGVFPVRGDFKKIQALIYKVKSMGNTNWRLTAEEYEDFLQLAITTAMNEYKLKVMDDSAFAWEVSIILSFYGISAVLLYLISVIKYIRSLKNVL